jgi:DNA relaxase NicK
VEATTAVWTILETRVDWLTLTATHAENAGALLDAGLREMGVDDARGLLRKPASFQGYVGVATDHVFAGWRADGACCRISSARAGASWRNLRVGGARATRIDLAVTARAPSGSSDVAYSGFYADRILRGHGGTQPGRTLIQSTAGGSTLYLGRRTSARYGRLYDKHKESKGAYPTGTWRYEVEFKRKDAEVIACLLERPVDERKEIMNAVGQMFVSNGVDWPLADSTTLTRYETIHDIGSDERRLEWLRASVSPAIERLSLTYTREELLRALGMWQKEG